ncbi:MAG: NAD(P)/FAD-dependent oxidoreductase [Bacteroidota bacterium]
MIQKSAYEYSLNIPDTDKPRVVIIGGGFGGINIIKKLKSSHFQVVIFDRHNYHTFQPLLYQVATAGLEPDSVAGPLRKILDGKKEIYFRMLEAGHIDTEENKIHTVSGSLSFDYLVIASGAVTNYFGNDDIEENAFPLKQISHAMALRNHIFSQFERMEIMTDQEEVEKQLSYVVVGAGPTGVELCGTLAELKEHILKKDYPDLDITRMKIFLVEGLPAVLPTMSEKSGHKARKYLEDMGVETILESMTESYDGDTVRLNTGRTIRAGTLIWAAGVKGNFPGGFGEGSITKGKLHVNSRNQVYRDKEKAEVFNNIFAIGDVSFMEYEGYPKGLPGLAQVAVQQGKHLAKNINRMAYNKNTQEFKYKNKGVLATIGRNRAVADFPRNIHISGVPGWFIWSLIHLLFLVGFRNKTVVFTNWLWNYFTWDRGMRVILQASSKEKDKTNIIHLHP